MSNNQYCKFLSNCLSFHQGNIRYCTTLQLGRLISTYQEKTPKEIAEKIILSKKEIEEGLDKNVIPSECENCIYRNKEVSNNDKIQRIDLYYWYHCNCGCFYCSYRDETKGEYSDKAKEGNPFIYKVLEELYKNKKIDEEELYVNVGGGELGVLKEFPKMMRLFLKHNVKNVTCESSGIKYSREVEKLLKLGKGNITVAVCSGKPETYKKIKHRDKYKQVMKNLERYVKAAKKYKPNSQNVNKVVSKYIILQGFNDNFEEVEQWLNESVKYGIKQVEISMEFCWGTKTKIGQKIEDYNYKIFDYVEQRCKELNLELRKNCTSLALMEQGTY